MPKVTAQRLAIALLVLAALDMLAGQKTLAMIFAALAIAISLGAASWLVRRASTARPVNVIDSLPDREAVAALPARRASGIAGVVDVGDRPADGAAEVGVGGWSPARTAPRRRPRCRA